jgi:hypothetical protein
VANVKVIGGSVVNTAGVPLPSKTVTLKNDDTNTTLTTTTTNADGEWEFPPRDETVRYRAEAAFGGSSSQVVVRKPASAEFDHLYANLSFRSAAGATVVFGGPVSVGGALTVTGAATITGAITSDSDMIVNGVGNFEALGVAGGAFIVGGDGALIATALATFGDVGVSQLGLTAGGQIRLPINTTATPPITSVTDTNTGLRWPGSDQLQLIANGQEIARVWMNGASTQFASYAAQTLIQNAILIGGAMTTATSVTGVVRKILIQDTSGNFVGWVPVYGASS